MPVAGTTESATVYCIKSVSDWTRKYFFSKSVGSKYLWINSSIVLFNVDWPLIHITLSPSWITPDL